MKTESQQSQRRQQILRFDANARVEVFVDNLDIESDNNFNSIMELNVSDEEKIQKLKIAALEIANEAIESVEGIKITSDLSIADIDIDTIDWTEMFDKFREDKELMAEMQPQGPIANNNMKIKLSKNQWEEMGRKAGWIKKAYSNPKNPCPKCGNTEYDILNPSMPIIQQCLKCKHQWNPDNVKGEQHENKIK